jgi:hypothetical protein
MQLLSLQKLSYFELIENSSNKSVLNEHPLTKLKDLTENDLVLRQINYASIVDRILNESITNKDKAKD